MSEMAQREAYGRALADLGEINPKVVVVDADTSSSTLTHFFASRHPDRFFNTGIAEPCMVDFGVGLSLGGFIPYVNAFSAFLTLRAVEQVRTCVAYSQTNVKLVGHYAGVSDYKDGPTHHCNTDLAIMRALPGMRVIIPADANETRAWVPLLAEIDGPVYFRVSRDVTWPVHQPGFQPVLGKAVNLRKGSDLTFIATGGLVGRCLKAAETLDKDGIRAGVLEVHTIKPIDREAICTAAAATGVIVTAEEHFAIGGLGGAVCEVLAEECPVPVIRIGLRDEFPVTGPDADSLMDHLGLGVQSIIDGAKAALRKRERN